MPKKQKIRRIARKGEKGVFDEAAYLTRNPDVRDAIAQGVFASAHDHFLQYGQNEGRIFAQVAPAGPAPVSATPAPAPKAAAEMPQCMLEHVLFSRGGGIFLVGWVNDAGSPVSGISLRLATNNRVDIGLDKICRVRREDVEKALSSPRQHHYGFFAFMATELPLAPQECDVTVQLKSGAEQVSRFSVRAVDDAEIRDVALAYFGGSGFFGNRQLKSIAGIAGGLGQELVRFNRALSRSFCATPYVESFGKSGRGLKGSIIVCLYGKPEYMYLQAALFSGLEGMEDYEFVYVCNSPELSEPLLREARISSQVYGLNQTLVLLGGNAGFGAANNVASRFAHSRRLLFMNPDVFPYQPDWARRHTEAVSSLPAEQTALFGVPLFYDDGSLMHGGMHFELDTIATVEPGSTQKHESIRVEHYGKGSPPGYARFQAARAVPAVTGAFMSFDRRWFEHLEGFTEEFIFGHYEDADLCLKSLAGGIPAWMHDIKLWHLEGQGSVRRPEHEGGSLVNRWTFSKNWAALIKEKLLGPSPDLSPLQSTETLQSVLGSAGPRSTAKSVKASARKSSASTSRVAP